MSANVFAGFDHIPDENKTFITDDVNGPYPTLGSFILDTLVPHWSNICFETDIVDGTIRIPFEEPIAKGIDYNSIALSYENNLYFYGSNSADKQIKREASKFVLPFSSYIEGNELVIIPENYDPTMNYSVFIEPNSITDLKGSPIRNISKNYRLRILAKSPGVESTIPGTNIVALLAFNEDMSKANLVSKGLKESTVYTNYINAFFNKDVRPNPFANLNAIALRDQNNTTIASSKVFTGLSLAITPDETLNPGEYTITIPSNTFIGVGGISYTFEVENEIAIKIAREDIGGTLKVNERVFLKADYLDNALRQDDELTYQWYSGYDENYQSISPIANANSYAYTLTENEQGEYLFVSVSNDNVFEISSAIGIIDSPYNNYCHVDNLIVEYDQANLLAYDSNIDNYDLTVSAEKDRVYVSAEFSQVENMKVYINGIDDSIWQEEGKLMVPLDLGDNQIIVKALAENENATKTYTINITRDESLGAENLKPRAQRVSIDNPNDNYVGQTLLSTYEYQDDLSRPEGQSELKWYKRKNNVTEEIQGANSYEYTIKGDDVGYTLMFSIRPITETGVKGDEIQSLYTQQITLTKAEESSPRRPSSPSASADLLISESEKGKDVNVTVKQGDVVITFNGKDFADLRNKDVRIKVEEISKESLNISEELKAEIGNFPIYDISLFVGGEKASFESEQVIVIEIPILTDYGDHKIVAVYIDENGQAEIMEGVVVDGIMRFTINHLSHYALMYVDKSFEDVASHWGKIAVEALASRGIINGKSATVFDPDGQITRAEFATLMVRYFNLTAYATDLGYRDVISGSWYENYVWTSKELGILPEIYGDRFEPNKAISREEMMYILYRALSVTHKLDNFSHNQDSISDFSDGLHVADYAKQAASYLISRDIINGDNHNMINPASSSSRAEVAQMLWNMISMSN